MPRVASPVRSLRARKIVTTTGVVALAAAVVVGAGGGPAAAADLKAQAVGRFLDGTLGGMPIEGVVDVKDARATAPGTTSAQNPFDITLGGQGTIPLSNVVSIPTAPAADAGVVNQVAHARLNGQSLGASGAVNDDGGVSAGDDNDSAVQPATINLTDAAFGSVAIPGAPAIPGTPGGADAQLPALGGITAQVGAVYGRVGTESGGAVITPRSGIAGLNLQIGSPALAALLNQLKAVFASGGLDAIPLPASIPALPANFNLPPGCALTDAVPSTIDFGNGVSIDPGAKTAGINIDVAQLVSTALNGTDISNLDTSNFDLVDFLVQNLPNILSKGLSRVVTALTTELGEQFQQCIDLFPAPLSDALKQVTQALLDGQKTFVAAIQMIGEQFGASGASGLAQLSGGLKNLLDIGLNVQSGPGIEPRNENYPFESELLATPNQGTAVVDGQTVVRAIEINVLSAKSLPDSIPLPSGSVPAGGALTVAMGNAAAGPSTSSDVVTQPSDSTTPRSVPNTAIPTGIPAGAAGGPDGGLPLLPLVALVAVAGVAAAAFWQYRGRGTRLH